MSRRCGRPGRPRGSWSRPGWPGWPGWMGWGRLGPRPGRERRASNSNPGAVPLQGSGPAGSGPAGSAGPAGSGRAGIRGIGPVAARGMGPVAARVGRGRGGREGPRAPSASGWPVGSLVTCALPSSGCPQREKRRKRGDKPGKPICPFPRRSYRPAWGVTGTFAYAVARSGAESAASDSGHTLTAGCLEFFRPWPGWRRVALIGQSQSRLRILEEGFTGRCPPCLLGHRRVTRRSASPKLHKSVGH